MEFYTFEQYIEAQQEKLSDVGITCEETSNIGTVASLTHVATGRREDMNHYIDTHHKIRAVAMLIEYAETYGKIHDLALRLAAYGCSVGVGGDYKVPECCIGPNDGTTLKLALSGYNWSTYNKLLDLACNLELLAMINAERELFESLCWDVVLPTINAIIQRVEGKKTWPNLEVKVLRRQNKPNDTDGILRKYTFDIDSMTGLIKLAKVTEEILETKNVVL